MAALLLLLPLVDVDNLELSDQVGAALEVANFGLALPLALIKDLDLVLQEDQHRWHINPGKFVLEPIWEAFVKLPIKCTVIPTSPRSVVRYMPTSRRSLGQVGSWGYRNCLPRFSLGSRESHSYIGSKIGSLD